MGMFHYLLLISLEKPTNKKEMVNFFKEKNFITVCEADNHTMLEYCNSIGKIEVLIDDNQVFSIRTNIRNDAEVLESVYQVLMQFELEMGTKILIGDFQTKQKFGCEELRQITQNYKQRQKEIKRYFN